MIGRIGQLLRLVVADLRGEWPIAVAQTIAIAAVLTPLLVLFGLRDGVIGALIGRLDRDPGMRLITPVATGANRFNTAWFDEIAAWRSVAFVIPSPRQIAGQIDLFRSDPATAPRGGGATDLRVTLLPTAFGDPIVGENAAKITEARQIIVSAGVSDRLQAVAGDNVTAYIERSRDGRIEPLQLSLRIVAVLPIAVDGGRSVYASLALAEAITDYRDGMAVPALDVTVGFHPRRDSEYPLFRLYTRSIRDVGAVTAALEARGISVSTRQAEIASALSLDRSLRTVLLIVSAISIAGYVVAVTAGQWGNMRRKRRDLAILNLAGYGTGWMVAFPVAQAGVLAAAGGSVAVAGFFGAAGAINAVFQDSMAVGEAACRLGAEHLLLAGAATMTLSLLPAATVGLAFRRLDVNEELRNV